MRTTASCPSSRGQAKLLDALASVMLQYPRVGLIVSVHEIEQPNSESDAPVAGAPERSIIARRRADAIVDALLRRQVLARRIESRTLPQAAPSSQLTLTLLAPNGKSVPPRAPVPVPVPSPGEAKSEARPDTALKAVREELQALRKAFEAPSYAVGWCTQPPDRRHPLPCSHRPASASKPRYLSAWRYLG